MEELYYLFPIAILVSFLLLLGYFRLAEKLNIVDKPNERSSHKITTIRGGAIVFPLIVIPLLLIFTQLWYLTAGLFIISAISLYDDFKPLKASRRVLVHFLAFGLMTLELHPYIPFWWIYPIIFIVCVGAINAYNFMDGINGITGLNTLAILVSVFILNRSYEIMDANLLVLFTAPVLAFLFFNYRKRAKCFAGDVGSISIAFIVVFLLVKLILITQQIEFIFLMGLYGIDSILTLVQRLLKGENIFKPHRSHLYQVLANEVGWSHRQVSALYFVLQMGLNLVVIYLSSTSNDSLPMYVLAMYVPLALMYFPLKTRLMRS